VLGWLPRAQGEEHGFTLPEVLITLILLGILFGIATSTWFGIVESRRVDSAANQLAADLRLAHSKAANRLAQQTVTLTSGNSEYTVTGLGSRDLDDDPDEDLVAVAAATTIVFQTNGQAQVTGANPVTVRSTNDATNNHTIEINTMTSRIKIVP
jgi:prepilin-type N-terminal cleavage/methylation domain-containing protein